VPPTKSPYLRSLLFRVLPAPSTQHPTLGTQHCAVILILEAISYPTLNTPFFLRSRSNGPRLQTMLQGKLQAKPHPNAISCFPLPQCQHQVSGLMKPFPPTHRMIVTFPCGLKNSRMDTRGAPTISRVLSKLRAVSLVWKY
jgi:hypothetical protein